MGDFLPAGFVRICLICPDRTVLFSFDCIPSKQKSERFDHLKWECQEGSISKKLRGTRLVGPASSIFNLSTFSTYLLGCQSQRVSGQ